MPTLHGNAESLVDALIGKVGKQLVVGLPLGIGKATHIADALFARAAADATLSVTFFTGLTLTPPSPGDDVTRRFVGPLSERLYGGWPTPAYASALSDGTLPKNVAVHEFYLRPGAFLGNPLVQQSYTSVNYSQVARELIAMGVNVVAQLISADTASPDHYSLSSNPEITLDLLEHFDAQRANGTPVAMLGQVNRRLPYMLGDAEIARSRFDLVLDDDALEFPLFGLPNRPVGPADYATAMHVASLVRDGGTLQVGIGSLSDALAHCLILRHTEPAVFSAVLQRLPGGSSAAHRPALPLETEPFSTGLFASTELVSDALFALFEAGIVKRPADDRDPCVIHGGFFVGSPAFYEKLRDLTPERRALINMTHISAVNTLFGDERRKRQQRQRAVFVNETMMATLLGAAVSDALDDGRVVSGVGGQFDFVRMGLELDDAHSILMVRAIRESGGKVASNIRASYGHATVPRHHRDVYVSEYGLAATRGRSDAATIRAMLGIADARFQESLAATAKTAGKFSTAERLPAAYADNTPAAIAAVFGDREIAPYFPTFPLGTSFTPTEQALLPALAWLGKRTAQPWHHAGDLARAVFTSGKPHTAALERMQLTRANARERLLERLLRYALDRMGDDTYAEAS